MSRRDYSEARGKFNFTLSCDDFLYDMRLHSNFNSIVIGLLPYEELMKIVSPEAKEEYIEISRIIKESRKDGEPVVDELRDNIFKLFETFHALLESKMNYYGKKYVEVLLKNLKKANLLKEK